MKRRDLLKMLPAGAVSSAFGARTPQHGKPRLKTAICAYSYREALGNQQLAYEDLVDIAVDHNIDGLDLTVYWFPKTGLDPFLTSLRRKAYVSAVEIPSIAIRSDLCKPEARDREIEVAWLSYWVDVADRLGASHIRCFGGRVPDGSTEDEAVAWCAEILTRAAEYAGKKGVILGLENHGGITLHAKRIIEIVERVDSPWVGINLDTGNFRSDHYAQMEMCLPFAVNSQFKVSIHHEDGRREPCDWERIAKMFADAGYKGYLSLEYEEKEDAKKTVPHYLKKLRHLALKHSS